MPTSTGTATRRAGASTRGGSLPSGASRSATAWRSSVRRTRISTMSRPARLFSSAGVPVAIDRPWSMITTWSASWSASSRYCVVNSTSVPARTSARMASHSSMRLRGSSPVVGSSRSSSRGAPTRLAPRSSRRRMPPEYPRTRRSAASVNPIWPSTVSAAARAARRSWPNRRATITRFSRPLRAGSTAADCPASPIARRTRSGCAAASMSVTRSSPSSGRISVATARTKVVLPAPLGPSTAVTAPAGATRSSPSRATTSPNVLRRPVASIVWLVMATACATEVDT